MEGGAVRILSPDEKGLVYEYSRLFGEITDRFGLDLWAVGGTALGAARHGDAIPWDDDVDFAVREEERTVLERRYVVGYINSRGHMLFRERNAQYGFVYHVVKPAGGITESGMVDISPEDWGRVLEGRHPVHRAMFDICSDVFLYRREGGSRYNLHWEHRKIRKDQSVDESSMGRCRYGFGPVQVYSFCDLESYLAMTFGPDWRDPVFTHAHRPSRRGGGIARPLKFRFPRRRDR
jgi:hypothetical protein